MISRNLQEGNCLQNNSIPHCIPSREETSLFLQDPMEWQLVRQLAEAFVIHVDKAEHWVGCIALCPATSHLQVVRRRQQAVAGRGLYADPTWLHCSLLPSHFLTDCLLQNSEPKSREILMFVCLQKDVKQCCDATELDCTHCPGHWIQLSVRA